MHVLNTPPHSNQTWSFHDSCHRPELAKGFFAQALSKNVFSHFFTRTILEDYGSFANLLPDKMMRDINVLCSSMILWVLGHSNGGLIISVCPSGGVPNSAKSLLSQTDS